MKMTHIYNVGTLRNAGLEAKWSKTRKGQPCLLARDPKATTKHQRETWWFVSAQMVAAMERDGIREGFSGCTILGDMFSVAV